MLMGQLQNVGFSQLCVKFKDYHQTKFNMKNLHSYYSTKIKREYSKPKSTLLECFKLPQVCVDNLRTIQIEFKNLTVEDKAQKVRRERGGAERNTEVPLGGLESAEEASGVSPLEES